MTAIGNANGTVDDDLKALDHTDLNVIRKDFLSILSLLYAQTTKIALCLKPSSPAYSASVEPLKELSRHIGTLSQNVRLIRAEHGLTLLKEYKSVSKNVASTLKQFGTILLEHQESKQTSADETYLAKAAEIHHVIDKARDANGLSPNNHTAVRKIWAVEQGSLDDALNEIRDQLQNDPGNEADDFDDGWNELGIEAPSKMSPEELERLNKVRQPLTPTTGKPSTNVTIQVEPIVKLSTLLNKYIIKRVLSAPFDTLPTQVHVNPLLDQLADDSSAFSAAVDDLASTVYAPQDAEEMSLQLQHFSQFKDTIFSRITSILSLPSVSELMNGSGKEGPAQKWLDTCSEQLDKSIKQLSALLPSEVQ
jgi:Grap2 and cyclin-D-interacting